METHDLDTNLGRYEMGGLLTTNEKLDADTKTTENTEPPFSGNKQNVVEAVDIRPKDHSSNTHREPKCSFSNMELVTTETISLSNGFTESKEDSTRLLYGVAECANVENEHERGDAEKGRKRTKQTSRRWRLILFLMFLVPTTIFFCEYLLYYLVIAKCSWPETEDPQSLRVMFLADTHLLGFRHGAWIDRVRREWQMERSFQTSLQLLKPDVVFILGDIFDEGKWCPESEWEQTMQRFRRIFRHPPEVQLHSVIGNHDVGFHYSMNTYKVSRFEKDFGSSVQYKSVRGVDFFLVNSMAFTDKCFVCQDAEKKFTQAHGAMIAEQWRRRLKKLEFKDALKKGRTIPMAEDRPILLLHFPLYRESEALCTQTDSPGIDLQQLKFEKSRQKPPPWRYGDVLVGDVMCDGDPNLTPPEGYREPRRNGEGTDVVSQTTTNWIMHTLRPRFIFSGHTHHHCSYEHPFHGFLPNVPEVTVSTFIWRNRVDPSFVLARISNDTRTKGEEDSGETKKEFVFSRSGIATKTCSLPVEITVFVIYAVVGSFVLLELIWCACCV
eukprot:comp19999_c0_seq1/m.24474 comp19999_c0_seq1/g.24474  ORF comp19999_c0_seq1/g.24474 comp19999_c0_seq1/m.24474 type:complete len:553 (-) comp19999_c0_seq1:459-2117(-)